MITVVGRLDNTACYTEQHRTRDDRRNDCAVAYTEQGYPVAGLEQNVTFERAWILLTVPQIFTDYMGRTVRVKGTIRSEGVLLPVRVEVQDYDSWTFIM